MMNMVATNLVMMIITIDTPNVVAAMITREWNKYSMKHTAVSTVYVSTMLHGLDSVHIYN